MTTFVPNNIRFRAVSACSLEHFYSTKAYILDVVLMERNQFSTSARETLLLLFNSYSKWATDIEYLFLNNHYVTPTEIDAVLQLEQRLQSNHLEIFELYPQLFTPEFIEAWYKVNTHTRNALRSVITGVEGQSHLEAYPIIMAALSASLQTCMYELYEIDCLLGSELVSDQHSTNRSNSHQMLVYVDNFALDYYHKTGIFMCEERLKFYSALACRRLPTLVKNYSSCNVVFAGVIEGDEPLATLLKRCTAYVDVIDVTVCQQTN